MKVVTMNHCITNEKWKLISTKLAARKASRKSEVADGRSVSRRGSRKSETPVPTGPALKFVEEFITNNSIAIFSKSWCPWCSKAKEVFNSHGLKYGVIELDLDENGANIQQALKYISGQKTVPNIYINNRHIGGYSELYPIFETGVLDDVCSGGQIDFEYDLVIIGGGSGGLAAAREASGFGKKVALCDFVVPSPLGTKWGLGGTCVNVGCIPKKLMHRASQIRNDMSDALDFGWEFNKEGVAHNWEKMVTQVQSYIKSLNFGYRKMLMENNVKYFNAFGSFVDKHTLKLKTDTTESIISARNFIIATGGRPKYPDIPGAKQFCITSDDLFSMKHRPGKVLVVGASYVALECAGFLNGLGYDTSVMVRSILLRGFDQQMAEKIEEHMISCGVKFIKNTVPTSFKKNDKTGAITTLGETNGKKTFSGAFDTILLAVGREACTAKLNLEGIGVKIHPTSKRIIVDEKERTSVPTIFAIGDVADEKPELTPVAIQAGKLLAMRLYNMSTQLMDYKNVPTSVFTPCEYGCVGFTEAEAITKHGEAKIDVYHQEFAYLEGVITEKAPKSYAKLIVLKEEKDELVIGAHIFCPNAGEIIQGFALGIRMGAKKKDFDDLVGIHPTVAEVFTTLTITKSSGKSAGATGC
ncbi:hypothetical protein GE061_005631 [Apolygus lucorum]|uniref:thioredoxin-disulfide reductase (NADPH) n=1 Tax=Apolygus lucorum TaxID=248454 RepID=A0A6A4J0X3_APOLU|nr:hypothetical protein GE061_005631 [Apolygus lucorum]